MLLPCVEEEFNQPMVENVEKVGERTIPETFTIDCNLCISYRQCAMRPGHTQESHTHLRWAAPHPNQLGDGASGECQGILDAETDPSRLRPVVAVSGGKAQESHRLEKVELTRGR